MGAIPSRSSAQIRSPADPLPEQFAPPTPLPELLQGYGTASYQAPHRPGHSARPHRLCRTRHSDPAGSPAHPTPSSSEHRRLFRDALRLTLWRVTGSPGAWLVPQIAARKRADGGAQAWPCPSDLSVISRMPRWFTRTILFSVFVLAAVVLGFDREGLITVFAALLLALITLLTSYTHVDLLGAASFDLPQQAGIPCIAAAVAMAIEQQVGIQRSTSTWSATGSSRGCNGSRARTRGSRRSTPGPSASSGSTCLARPHPPPQEMAVFIDKPS